MLIVQIKMFRVIYILYARKWTFLHFEKFFNWQYLIKQLLYSCISILSVISIISNIETRHGRDRMVVGFTTAYHHWSCEFEPRSWRGVLDTTLCDKVCQWPATDRWFSPVSSNTKTDRHDTNEAIVKSGGKHHKHSQHYFIMSWNKITWFELLESQNK